MTQNNWQRVEEIFYTVVEAPANRQEQVLADACDGDESLIKAVRNLLAADQRQNDTIPRAIRGMMMSITEPLSSGQRIGAYEVDREVGHGGMGTVYLAFRADDEFQKRVAIKLLRRGMEDPDLLGRFRQERQILAALDHPYIARLIDGGATEDGRPYLIMDYAEGKPITEYCRETGLSHAQRCRLFQKVCEAVDHAHRNLVVHRDLKPGNILVSGDGTPKLLDFGIAKLLGDAVGDVHETQTPLGMLTPSYASPEQVQGKKITTSTDVYSLGAVLFELLAGETAYQFANYSPREVMRVVCEVDPPRAKLPHELDSIVRKAMRKEIRERYASVAALDDDLQRFADGRPVRARGDSLLYRTEKFWRRHWMAVSAACLAAVSLAGTTVYAVRQAGRAERRFAQVRQLANKFLFDFHDSIAHLPGSTEARRQVVRTALDYLDSLAAEAAGDTELLGDLATAYERVGDVRGNPYYSNLGDTQGALESYERAMQLRKQIGGAAIRPRGFVRDMMVTQGKLADAYDAVGRTTEAEKLQNEALRSFSAIAMPSAAESGAAFQLLLHRGDVRDKQGRIREAANDYRDAAALLEKQLPSDPRNASLRNDFSTAKRKLGERLRDLGDRTAALENLRAALSAMEQVCAQEPANAIYQRNLMSASMALGSHLLWEDQFDRALEHLDRGVRIGRSLGAADARNVQAKSDLAVAESRIGDAYSLRKRYRDALPHYQFALAAARQAATADPANLRYQRDVGYHTLTIGNIAAELPDYEWSLRELTKGLQIIERLIEQDPKGQDNYWMQAQAYRDLGGVHALKRNWPDAVRHNLKALEALKHAPVFRRHAGPVYQQLGEVHESMARAAPGEKRREHLRDALNWWKRALDVHREARRIEGDTAARRAELKRIEERIRACEPGS